MKTPKEIWIVFDPLDGPHIFKSRAQAWAQFEKWEEEADTDSFDSFWDMSVPIKYTRQDK